MIESITSSKLFPDVKHIQMKKFDDDRGYFIELFNIVDWREHGLKQDLSWPSGAPLCQDNLSYSKQRVLRGLHFQCKPYTQAKLISVLHGFVKDVVVDIRSHSKTFGSWESFGLSGDSGEFVYVPEGFAHGFLVQSEWALFYYKVSDEYNKESAVTIAWNDPTLAIDWGVVNPLLSEADRNGISFKQYVESVSQ